MEQLGAAEDDAIADRWVRVGRRFLAASPGCFPKSEWFQPFKVQSGGGEKLKGEP